MFGLLTEVIFPGECGTLYNVNRAVTKQPGVNPDWFRRCRIRNRLVAKR